MTLRRGRWSAEEDAVVRKMYPDHTADEIGAVLNRPASAVRNRCWTLKLASKAVQNFWTDEEVQLLRETYSSPDGPAALAELAKRLGRSRANTCRKARSLGLTNQRRRKVEVRKAPPLRKFGTLEELREAQSRAARIRIDRDGHPRGALGMKHRPETLAVISQKSKAAWNDPASGLNSEKVRQQRSDNMLRRNLDGRLTAEQSYSRCKRGRRADVSGHFFRSAWEANYARYLNSLVDSGEIVSWGYECKVFEFAGVRRGVRSYRPDFRVTKADGAVEWHEVKGWLDGKSAMRLDRMSRYFPDEVVVLRDEGWFRNAERSGLAKSLPGWEFPARRRRAS